MSTYSEVVVSITSGTDSTSATKVVYTAPTGKYARVSFTIDGAGGFTAGHSGAVAGTSTSQIGNTNTNRIFLASGQSLELASTTGDPANIEFTALEFSNP